MVSMLAGEIPSRFSAINEDAPQSNRKRPRLKSTRMHAWNRPPLPKASPHPANVILTLTDASDNLFRTLAYRSSDFQSGRSSTEVRIGRAPLSYPCTNDAN